jgi:hypothetical protein
MPKLSADCVTINHGLVGIQDGDRHGPVIEGEADDDGTRRCIDRTPDGAVSIGQFQPRSPLTDYPVHDGASPAIAAALEAAVEANIVVGHSDSRELWIDRTSAALTIRQFPSVANAPTALLVVNLTAVAIRPALHMQHGPELRTGPVRHRNGLIAGHDPAAA